MIMDFFEDLSIEDKEMLKAGKAFVLDIECSNTMCGDGALLKCCVNNEKEI